MEAAVIMLGLFFVLVVMRVPMGVSIGLSSIVGLLVAGLPLSMLGQASFEALFSFSIVAIPFFILAGNLMTEGGISKNLVDLAYMLVGNITGGLAMVVVVASAFFAALSGSSTATTIAIGGMMTPELVKKGYDKDYALAISAAGGVIGPIIPPSVAFILYGVATNTSISDLFLGGIFPGILMMFALMIAVFITAKMHGYKGVPVERSFKAIVKTIFEAKWAIMVPIIILGGIYSGAFTPTEAGAVACVYALLVSAFIQKTLTVKKFFASLADSCMLSASVLFLIGSATVFGRVLVMAQIPQMVANLIISISSNRLIAMLLINVLLLICGCIMDASAAILIMSPILLPVATHFGYSPVHFGIILCANLTIGAITPPVGCCLFAASVMGERPLEKIAYKALPFLLALCVVLLLTICFPVLSTGLAEIIG